MSTTLYRKSIGISIVIHGIALISILSFSWAAPLVNDSVVPESIPINVLDMGMITSAPTARAEAGSQELMPMSNHVTSQPTTVTTNSPLPLGQGDTAQSVASGERAVVEGVGAKQGMQHAGGMPATAVKILSRSSPAYPSEAKRLGWEGVAVVRVLIGVDGSPMTVVTRNSSGYGVLDDAAVESVKTWQFLAATQEGRAITSYYDVKVRFILADAS